MSKGEGMGKGEDNRGGGKTTMRKSLQMHTLKFYNKPTVMYDNCVLMIMAVI